MQGRSRALAVRSGEVPAGITEILFQFRERLALGQVIGELHEIPDPHVVEGKMRLSPFSFLLVVVFQAQVRDQIFAAEVAQCVLELHDLDEDIVLGV